MRKDTEKAANRPTSEQGNQPCEQFCEYPHREDKKKKHGDKPEDKRDMMLSREDAKGGSPSDVSVGGEEDAGVGLEFLVNRKED